ncbi:MAG TPA: serine hydrolase domain-containing protein [Terriglobales bacterium]|nr:serine hydrolase domain-containing protein [Terriglobales bacterium]
MRERSSLTRAVPHPDAFPIAAHDDQDRRFTAAFAVLDEAITARAFPAASIAVTHQGKLVALRACGRFTCDSAAPAPTPDTLFDLASVTKVIATTTMAMILYQRGLLDLEMSVIAVVGEFAGEDPRRDEVTLRMLLAHSSGLPAYERLFLSAHTREELLEAVCSTPLVNDPASHVEYSDIGFIILGTALERLADESLDHFCQHEIFGPLGMTHTTFNPAPELRSSIPPTADDQIFRHRIIQGEVHDENASVLGGVAPHAGLFATAHDVATFAHAMLQGGHPILRPETLALFTKREASPTGTSRALGWDTPSAPSQSGRYFSADSYGHLGYTGTSLWIDPECDLSITLLTNRTWLDEKNQTIRQIRPRFHDAIIEALSKHES